jgi:hypothetical protein
MNLAEYHMPSADPNGIKVSLCSKDRDFAIRLSGKVSAYVKDPPS